MSRILIFVGMTVGGAVGWWLGDFMGLMGAVLLSAVGSGVGVWAVRWLEREVLS